MREETVHLLNYLKSEVEHHKHVGARYADLRDEASRIHNDLEVRFAAMVH